MVGRAKASNNNKEVRLLRSLVKKRVEIVFFASMFLLHNIVISKSFYLTQLECDDDMLEKWP
jgi:hypothetical protein